MNSNLLTVPEVAERIGVSRSKMWNMCVNGQVECIVVPCGNRVRRLIEEHRVFSLIHGLAAESTDSGAR